LHTSCTSVPPSSLSLYPRGAICFVCVWGGGGAILWASPELRNSSRSRVRTLVVPVPVFLSTLVLWVPRKIYEFCAPPPQNYLRVAGSVGITRSAILCSNVHKYETPSKCRRFMLFSSQQAIPVSVLV
jgi:hypothetical protein